MSNSALVTYTKISPNKTSPRNHVIDTISIHCMAGNLTIESCGNLFASSSRQASSNYGIGSDGRIGLYVEEKDRSWCTSNSANDHRAVTIEVANDGGAPDWHVSDAAMNSLIKLCADICKRNNIKQLLWQGNKALIGQVDKQNMTVHRWFASKSCPGNYLYNKHSYIAAEVNKLLKSSGPVPGPINGYLDSVSFNGKTFKASGWASAGQVGNQPVIVTIYNGSKVIKSYNITAKESRPDVKKAGYANNSGYTVSKALTLGNGTYTVKAFCGNKQLNNTKTFKVNTTSPAPKPNTTPKPNPTTPSSKVIKAPNTSKSFNKAYKNGKTYTVTVNNGLVMRKGAGTNTDELGTLAKGTKVTWYGYYTGSWKYVLVSSGTYKGSTVFVYGDYLK